MIRPVFPKARKHPRSFKEAVKGLVITEAKRTITGKTLRLYRVTPQGENLSFSAESGWFTQFRAHMDKPSKVITKGSPIYHPVEERRLTIQELKRIASFPDDYKFIGSYWEQWARIGNSVPPDFMKAVAETIRDEILEKIS